MIHIETTIAILFYMWCMRINGNIHWANKDCTCFTCGVYGTIVVYANYVGVKPPKNAQNCQIKHRHFWMFLDILDMGLGWGPKGPSEGGPKGTNQGVHRALSPLQVLERWVQSAPNYYLKNAILNTFWLDFVANRHRNHSDPWRCCLLTPLDLRTTMI